MFLLWYWKVEDSSENCILEDQYGPWLRAVMTKGVRRGEKAHNEQRRQNEGLVIKLREREKSTAEKGGEGL